MKKYAIAGLIILILTALVTGVMLLQTAESTAPVGPEADTSVAGNETPTGPRPQGYTSDDAGRSLPADPMASLAVEKEELVRAEKNFKVAELKAIKADSPRASRPFMGKGGPMKLNGRFPGGGFAGGEQPHGGNTENYDVINENRFLAVLDNPLSTFSIDVDTASYSNARRFINGNRMPPKDAVRIEELVNYFSYDYPQPQTKHPFSITTEISDCPWNDAHWLVHIGLQGKKLNLDKTPASNLVFLLDVSGSMSSANKLPLVQKAFNLLVENLREEDRVAIVVYAGSSGLVLDSTSGIEKEKILSAINRLRSGGSTAGAAGIQLAYKVAQENFRKEGNNRVILATDGDFNVGVSSDAALVRLIEKKREEGVFLTVLGFGTGNYKGSRMEKLANKGNGNYAYIDSIMEAKKVLVHELTSTLFTIAKDVKIQIEFNPARIKGYRLIGYENRMLKKEDFNDDKKDAGELGAGHTVTALYEIIPAGSDEEIADVDPLKYQKPRKHEAGIMEDELMTVKLRYKEPDADTSKLIVNALKDKSTTLSRTSDNFRFSAAVAGFGMLLRDSDYKGGWDFDDVFVMAKAAAGEDAHGYRAEFLSLVRKCRELNKVSKAD